MTGTWPLARAALAAQLDGITVSSPNAETLRALEFAPGGRQDVGLYPYCYPEPNGHTVTRETGGDRIGVKNVVMRVMLAPTGSVAGGEGMETLHKRYDAWCVSLTDALDDAVAMDATVDIYGLDQQFGPLGLFDDIDAGWGFDMTLGTMQWSESKTFSG
jgi:hypothetical protein